MILRIKIVTFTLLFPFLPVFAQKLKKADKITLANLETHIRYLSDDKLEGRRTGSPGEKAASDYIGIAFTKAGLKPWGDQHGWLQAFEIDEGRVISPDSYFAINDHPLALKKEFFPLSFSGTAPVSGSPAIALQESGVPWFIDLKEMLENNQENPHFDIYTSIREQAIACSKKGATALVLYNSSRINDRLSFDAHDKPSPAPIPIIYVTREAKRKYLKDESASVDLKMKVGFQEKKRTGHNVVGFLDNGASGTIIIGAHYDHLGYGEDSNSLYRGPERLVHHGADDNASGVAAIIELARLLAGSKFRNNNYLFIAFSGEELGLLGSKYFVEHPSVDLHRVDYMINLDMVGRLSDSSHSLTIGGYGTSPAWGELCSRIGDRKQFSIRFDSSGVGPSDHTSFYRKDIPVLFFFTGIHSDYHKPTDNPDKINYQGELEILNFVYEIIGQANSRGKLAFNHTRDRLPDADQPRFTVTLGIMPDYSFNGDGVRADGVSEGRPAGNAGLHAGDVIIQLGEYPVPTLEKYMEALSRFKKGDTTTVRYRRGTETLETQVQF
jgi:aminopeptidase YwaD